MKKIYLIVVVLLLTLNTSAQTDDCGTPTSLPVNISCSTTAFVVDWNGTGQVVNSATCTGGTAYEDGWFSVVGTGNTMTITVSATDEDLILAAYAGCGTGEITCNFINAGVTASITFATTNLTTYYIQIQRRSDIQSGNANNVNLTGNICATSAPAGCSAPSALTATGVTSTTANIGWTENGETTWDIEISTGAFTGTPTVNNTTNNPHTLTGLTPNTTYNYQVLADCGGSTSAWVDGGSFTTPALPPCSDPSSLTVTGVTSSTANIGWTANGQTTWDIEISTGAFIGTPTVNNTTNNPHTVTGLTANTTYNFQVLADCGGSTSAWVDGGSFTTPAAGVGVDAAWPGLDIGTLNCTGSPYSYANNLTGASDECSQRGIGYVDHIYSFTLDVAADVTITVCDPAYDGYIYLYNLATGNCDSGSIDQDDDTGCGSIITQAALAAGTYVLVITTYSSGSPGDGSYTLDIDVENCQNSGDAPCDAIGITTTCGAKTIGTNAGKTDSGEAIPSCGTYAGADVWYTTLIPASGNIDITLQPSIGGITDVGMAAYTATSCAGPLTEIACNNTSMPSLNLTGLTPGDIIYTRVWENGSDQIGTFELEITDPVNLFCLTNDATMFNYPTDTCMQVTSDNGSQVGCAWYQNTLDFSQDFDHTIEVYLGDDDGGADGMTFTFHNDPQGTSKCGDNGQFLGAGGIQNALVIEVDTWDNGGAQDIVEDHISIWTSTSGEGSPIAGPVTATSPVSNIEDGVVHSMRITWNAATNLMEVHFDGVLRLSVTDDFVTNIFGSNNVFWGTTGSTGGASNQQYVCPPAALIGVILPIKLISFTSMCHNGDVALTWATASERNNDFFTIERSLDGINFEELERIQGAGNSNSHIEYHWEDNIPLPGINYYRLKQTDFDGDFSYSSLKAASCQIVSKFGIFPNPASNKINFMSSSKNRMDYQIFTGEGKVVIQGSFIKNKVLDISDLSHGVYVVRAISNSEIFQEKLIKE